MKTKNKLSLLAGVAALALVGTGYAAWHFNSDVEGVFTSPAVVTNKEAAEGEITISPETFYLVIDQNFLGWSTSNDKAAESYTALTSVTPTLTLDAESATTLDDFDYSCEFDGSALSAYVSFGTFADTWVSGEAVNLPTVSWVEGKKPTKEAQYDAMVAAIDGVEVSFTFNATIKA